MLIFAPTSLPLSIAFTAALWFCHNTSVYAGIVTVAPLAMCSFAVSAVLNCSFVCSAPRSMWEPLSTLMIAPSLTVIVAPAGATTLFLTVSVTPLSSV